MMNTVNIPAKGWSSPGRKKKKNQKAKLASNVKKKTPEIMKKFELKLRFDPRKLLTWMLVGFLILSFIFSLSGPVPQGEKSLPEVLNDIKEDKIEEVGIEGDNLLIEYKYGSLFNSRK